MTTESDNVSYCCDCNKSGDNSIKKSSGANSMSWDIVKRFHMNPPTVQLPREESVINRYRENISIIKMTYTIPEYLMEKLFSTGNKIVLAVNDYPYFTTSNVLHYLLWIHPNMHIEDSNINELICTKIPSSLDYQEFIYFENLGNNKSILDIRHFHVFIKIY